MTGPALMSFAPGIGAIEGDATGIAGGKGACLSSMAAAGLPVPPGFILCTSAFEAFLLKHGADAAIADVAASLDVDDEQALAAESERIRSLILSSPIPVEIEEAIRDGYGSLGPNCAVAVRSSAVGEDSETASFAGQQETFLNVTGADAVLSKVRECWASFFSPRAMFYRAKKGALSQARMAVVVQEMAFGEKSGVLFTVDPVQKRSDRMIVEAVFGLGEGIVSGLITPNQYVLDRDDGYLLDEFVPAQTTAIVHDAVNGGSKEVTLSEEQGRGRVLNEGELGKLHEMGLRLEQHFGGPQDVEWCIRGVDLLLLQSRPVTTM
jgi:pyruvate,water dikinase